MFVVVVVGSVNLWEDLRVRQPCPCLMKALWLSQCYEHRYGSRRGACLPRTEPYAVTLQCARPAFSLNLLARERHCLPRDLLYCFFLGLLRVSCSLRLVRALPLRVARTYRGLAQPGLDGASGRESKVRGESGHL